MQKPRQITGINLANLGSCALDSTSLSGNQTSRVLAAWNWLSCRFRKKAGSTLSDAHVLALLQDIAYLKQEHVVCLSLDAGGRLMARRTVFIGTLTGSIIHPREIFADPLTDHAAAIIVAHNHPSGDENPSEDDFATTQQLVAAGEILGIPLRDHIIVAHTRHFSFRANGLM